jgi:hypothetical protein
MRNTEAEREGWLMTTEWARRHGAPDPYDYSVPRANPILPVIAEIMAPVVLPTVLSDHIAAARKAA